MYSELLYSMLESKSYRTFIKKDLNTYFGQFGLNIVEEIQCGYTKVLKVKTLQREV